MGNNTLMEILQETQPAIPKFLTGRLMVFANGEWSLIEFWNCSNEFYQSTLSGK